MNNLPESEKESVEKKAVKQAFATVKIFEKYQNHLAVAPVEYLHVSVMAILISCRTEKIPAVVKQEYLLVAQYLAERLISIIPELVAIYQPLFSSFPKEYHPKNNE